MAQSFPSGADQTLTLLQESVRQQVADGYTALEDIETNLAERFELPASDPRRPLVAQLVRDAIEAHRREQATWPDVTDCDRLDHAFRRLEAAGVVARAHFTCCQNCGCHEIRDEIAAAQAGGRSVRGYAFFHLQDTERAVAGHALCLSYGPVDQASPPAAFEAIGRLVIGALREAGLRPEWNGSAAQRISLPLRWQRWREELEG